MYFWRRASISARAASSAPRSAAAAASVVTAAAAACRARARPEASSATRAGSKSLVPASGRTCQAAPIDWLARSLCARGVWGVG